MIPVFEEIPTDLDIEEEEETSLTFRLNEDTKTISGRINGVEAVKQAAVVALNTERMEHEIYGEDYGAELMELIGEPIPLVYVKIENTIKDTLMEDDRVKNVTGFSFEKTGNGVVTVSFLVETKHGDIAMEREVNM